MDHSQNFKDIKNDADLEAAINNKDYTATIVNYMTTNCSRSIYMKVKCAVHYEVFMNI